MLGVVILTLTGENGMITKAVEASFRTEMAAIREQVDLKLIENNMSNGVIEGFEQVTDTSGWDADLKKEIIYWGQVDLGISELTKDYAKNNADEIFEDNNLINNLYYINKTTAGGKEKTYLYDKKGDVVYKIPITTIGKYKVHSVEELNDCKGISNDNYITEESKMVTAEGISHYEPNLAGYSLGNTSIVYYEVRDANSTDTTQLATEVVPVEDYIKNGKQRTIEKNGITYEFYNYKKQRWANILVEKNEIKSYWVWIPRYSYKEDDVSDIKFIDLNSTPDEGYIVHSDFADGKKGIWVSKYEPIQTGNANDSSFPYYLPDLTGFKRENTYLEVYNKTENKFEETPLSQVNDIKDFARKNNWFNYYEQIWANIRVENPESNTGNTESWWVWIPRYAYNINGDEIGIIFVDLNNRPLDGSTLPVNYQTHPAFGNDKKGMWISKYEPVQKVETSSNVNPPNMKGYNVDQTYIECYDSSSNSFKEQTLRSILSSNSVIDNNNIVQQVDIDYSKIKGTWYNYAEQIWANIKVKNPESNSESWWVWIPRYAYNIVGDEMIVTYLDSNGNTLDGTTLLSNYVPHPAFSESPEGIWASKYEPIQK